MGFSALDGLVMGTRCGAIDPGVLLYLQKKHGLSVEALVNFGAARRNELTIVSKVLPGNASTAGRIFRSCSLSLDKTTADQVCSVRINFTDGTPLACNSIRPGLKCAF